MTLTLQPTKQSDMAANNNTYKVSKNEQHLFDEDKNEQVHLQIKIHLKNITKIEKYKKLKYKVSKNKHTTDEDKNNQIHSQIKIHNEHLENIIKLKNTKN